MVTVVSSSQPLPEHGVYTVFVELGNTKIEVSFYHCLLNYAEDEESNICHDYNNVYTDVMQTVYM